MIKRKLIYIGRSSLNRNRANLIQTLHTVEALQRLGVDVTLLLPPWRKSIDCGDLLKMMGLSDLVNLTSSIFLKSYTFDWSFPLYCRLHKRALTRVDAVYCRSAQVSRVLAKCGINHAFEVHNADKLCGWEGFNDIAKAYASGVIVCLMPISRQAADILVAAGLAADRMCVVPSGVDLTGYRQVPALDKLRLADKPTTVYLGRISNSRGLEILAEIARRKVCRVELVGDTEDPVPEVEDLNRHPFVPHGQVPEWYSRADLVLLPYQPGLEHGNSISPIKIFEAMAAGRPIIVSDLPPIREIIKHGVTGLLVDPQDVDSWVDAVRLLQSDPDLAAKLAASARETASRYTWEARAGTIIRQLGWGQ